MTPVAATQRRPVLVEAAFVVAMFLSGVGIGFGILQTYRAGGGVPRYYQENFAPAVMMACGYGFTMPGPVTAPKSLGPFLLLERDDFNCADFPSNTVVEPVTWNGTWYYLYGTTAAVWRVTGLSWRALDWLAAVFVGVSWAALYGLFRLVASRGLSVIAAMLLTLLPVNLVQMSALRDFSKVPFVLVCVWLLARLVIRPMPWSATIAMAAAFGAVVGFGYGFRTDLMIMVPFGLAVIALLLPGAWRQFWARNLTAMVAALAVFLVVASPPLRGLRTGGCQFHYSLLGLTSPMTDGLGVRPALYSFGDNFLDTFVDLKVGDQATRTMGLTVPNLCDPNYDLASGELFFSYARTFPADLITRAYGAVLIVLRSGMQIPDLYGPLTDIPVLVHLLEWVKRQPDVMGLLGPIFTFGAVCLAWVSAPRLGIALTAFVLFLAGYPAIEFESRHWFHLRFIPWWSLLLIVTTFLRHRRGFSEARLWRRGVAPAAATVMLMAVILLGVRVYQHRVVTVLAEQYTTAPLEALAITERQGPIARVDWQPLGVAEPPNHRAADLLAVTVESSGCVAPGPVDIKFAYDADNWSHDMSTTVRVRRGTPGSPPTTVFVPIFMQGFQDLTYMRFRGIEVTGGDTACVSAVSRVRDRDAIALWVQFQLPPDWRQGPLHQSLRAPWPLRKFR